MKEERHPNSGKLAIRIDNPRRRIKMKLCMVGGLPCVVIHVKCDPNRLRGYGAVGSRKWPFPITLASGLYNSLYYRTSHDRDFFLIFKGFDDIKHTDFFNTSFTGLRGHELKLFKPQVCVDARKYFILQLE